MAPKGLGGIYRGGRGFHGDECLRGPCPGFPREGRGGGSGCDAATPDEDAGTHLPAARATARVCEPKVLSLRTVGLCFWVLIGFVSARLVLRNMKYA